MGRLTVGAGERSARRRGPGAWAQLPGGNLGLMFWLGRDGPMVREVLRAALSSEPGAATPGELRHGLVADLVFGSEHRAVPGPGMGRGQGPVPVG